MAQGEISSPLKIDYGQDPLARWLSDHGKPVEFIKKRRTLRVLVLQFCDDVDVHSGSKNDLRHNVGIVAEWYRVSHMKMVGPKSSFLTTESTEGITPDLSLTLKRTWVGGRDGEFIPDTGLENRLGLKAADEAERTLGVWPAASGTIDTQQAV